MSEELVQRLRECAVAYGGGFGGNLISDPLREAADRIEALERALRFIARQNIADIYTTEKMRNAARAALENKQ